MNTSFERKRLKTYCLVASSVVLSSCGNEKLQADSPSPKLQTEFVYGRYELHRENFESKPIEIQANVILDYSKPNAPILVIEYLADEFSIDDALPRVALTPSIDQEEVYMEGKEGEVTVMLWGSEISWNPQGAPREFTSYVTGGTTLTENQALLLRARYFPPVD